MTSPVVTLCLRRMSLKTPESKSEMRDFGTKRFSHGCGTSHSPCCRSSNSALRTLFRKSMYSASFSNKNPGTKLNPFTKSWTSYTQMHKYIQNSIKNVYIYVWMTKKYKHNRKGSQLEDDIKMIELIPYLFNGSLSGLIVILDNFNYVNDSGLSD